MTTAPRLLQLSGQPVNIESPFSNLYYLTTPFSDPEWEVQEERYNIVTDVAAALINRGHSIFSPITHNFPLIQAKRRLKGLMPREATSYTNFHEWQFIDKAILQVSCCMLVTAVLGWSRSRGLKEEMEYAKELDIAVEFIIPAIVDVTIPQHHECHGEEMHQAILCRTKRKGFGNLPTCKHAEPMPCSH